MAFESGIDLTIQKVGAGEIWGDIGVVSSYTNFQDGLIAGRFAKYNSTTDAVENIDGSADPVIAGVVRRSVTEAIENDGVYKTDLGINVDVVESGLVSVEVVGGVTPKKFDKVYVYNGATAEERGKVTNDTTDSVAVDGYFYKQVSENIWVIRLK
jgi:hypothetical protein